MILGGISSSVVFFVAVQSSTKKSLIYFNRFYSISLSLSLLRSSSISNAVSVLFCFPFVSYPNSEIRLTFICIYLEREIDLIKCGDVMASLFSCPQRTFIRYVYVVLKYASLFACFFQWCCSFFILKCGFYFPVYLCAAIILLFSFLFLFFFFFLLHICSCTYPICKYV